MEDIVENWLAEQLRHIRSSLPSIKASITELLSMSTPKVPTVVGREHFFRKEDLESALRLLPEHLLNVRLFPLTFSKSEELGEGAYMIQGGELAALTFSKLMDGIQVRKTEDNVYYTYKSVVYEFLRRYPSLGVIAF